MKSASLFSVAFAALLLATGVPAPATIVGLLPPGMDSSEAIAINNNGLVLVRASVAGQRIRSWLREPNGGFVDPGVPAGFQSGSINGINDLGYAVASVGGGTFGTAAVRSPDGTWSLPMPSRRAVATGINNEGVIVGYETPLGSQARMFMHEPGYGVTLIPGVGAPEDISDYSTGPGINNQGTVFGIAFTGPNRFQAFRYSIGDGLSLLPSSQGQNSEAAGANDFGEIVGWAGLFGGSIGPVKWLKDGTFKPLPPLSGFDWASGINNLGDMVGSGFLAGPRAVIWFADLSAIDLNELLTPEERLHWELIIAYQINDHRQVVGMGRYDPDGPGGSALPVQRGFILQIPEPAPAVLSFASIVLVLLCRTRAMSG